MDKRAIFVNTASQVIVRFITLAFTLVSIKLLTRYLGPSGVGNYNTITTYINFFIVIADLGLFAVAVREISKTPERERKLLGNIFLLRLVSALAASAVAIIIVFFTDYSTDIKYGVLFGTGFLFFNLMSSVYDMALQCRLKMQFSALAEFLSKLISLILLWLIILNHGSFIAVTFTILVSGVVIFLFKWFFSLQFVRIKPEYDKKIFTWLFHTTWPIGVVFIVNNLFFKLDTLMLFVIKGSYDVGIYSVSYKVLEVTAFIAGYFTSALKPTITKGIQTKDKTLPSVMTKSILVLALIVAPIAASSIVFSREIIEFLSTKEFIVGHVSLILLSLTLPFIYIITLLTEILIANDSRRTMIKISVFILLFNFLTNLVIIPRFAYVGAAATTLASNILLFAITFYATRKIVSYHMNFKELMKIVLIFALTLVFGYFVKATGIYFLILMAAMILFYIALCQVFGTAKLSSLRNLLKSN